MIVRSIVSKGIQKFEVRRIIRGTVDTSFTRFLHKAEAQYLMPGSSSNTMQYLTLYMIVLSSKNKAYRRFS